MNTTMNHEHIDNEVMLQKFVETLEQKKKAIEKRKNDIVYAKSQLSFLEREKQQIQEELSVYGITDVTEETIKKAIENLDADIYERNNQIAQMFEEMDK